MKAHQSTLSARRPALTGSVIAVLLVILSSPLLAQTSLGDLASQGGVDWMAGRWVAMDDQGQEIVLIYAWQLDKHVLSCQLKMPEFEYQGMILNLASEEKITQVGADNKGRTSQGVWEGSYYGEATLTLTQTNAYGQTEITEFRYSQPDSRTMKIEIYPVSGSGVSTFPRTTVEFTRKAAK